MQREAIAIRARSEVDRLVASGVVLAADLRPCTGDDINTLEAALGVRLPESYRAFLSLMGRGAGDFLVTDHWTAYFDDLVALNRDVHSDRDLDGAVVPPDCVCFATRMGEVYLFVVANGSVDPPVLFWNEGSGPELRTAYASFWDWFAEMTSDYQRWRS